MARLTLHEQGAMIADLRADLGTAQEKIAELRAANAAMQTEVARSREDALELVTLREQVANLTKERDEAKSSVKYYSAEVIKAQNEIEQAHAVLDGVDGAPARNYRTEGSEYDRQRNVVTRLAGAFLAIAQRGSLS